MQAASALLANALAAPGGDGAAAPDAPNGRDGFTSALAALMGVLGQAQPAAGGPAPPPPSGGAASANAPPAAFQPAATPGPAAATSSTATALLADMAGGMAADALQALDAVVADLEATQRAVQSAGAPPGASPNITGAPTASSGSDAAGLSNLAEEPLLALLSGLSDQMGAGAAAPSADAAGSTGPPAGEAASMPPSPALDPQLVRFVARAIVTSESDAPVSDGSPAAPAPAASPDAGAPAAGALEAQTGTTGGDAQAPAPANPVAAGLIVFNPAGGQPSPPLAAARPTAARTTASNASPALAAAKSAGLPDIAQTRLVALDPARGGADTEAPTVGDDPGQASGDGGGAGDLSSGASTAAFQLAAAPGAAAVTVPPAAAMLAQAHGADITAQLAAQIAGRVGAVRSSFDFSLEPQGLGRVDVNLKIDPQGGLSAVLSFDNPAVAAEARSRAGDLQQALQQAGFDVSQSGLSFSAGGGQGHGAAFQAASQPSYAAPAASLAETGAPELAAISATLAARRAAGGIDITI